MQYVKVHIEYVCVCGTYVTQLNMFYRNKNMTEQKMTKKNQ